MEGHIAAGSAAPDYRSEVGETHLAGQVPALSAGELTGELILGKILSTRFNILPFVGPLVVKNEERPAPSLAGP